MNVDKAMRQQLARQIAGIEEPRQPADRVFAAVLERLSAFVDRHGRLPARGALDPAETRLASWLDAQRRAEWDGALCAVRRQMLQERLGHEWHRPT